jgi:hypothetical protein
MWVTFVIKKTPQSKQPPKGRNFAQSGHPAAAESPYFCQPPNLQRRQQATPKEIQETKKSRKKSQENPGKSRENPGKIQRNPGKIQENPGKSKEIQEKVSTDICLRSI